MPNVIDYLQWRGDISMKKVPFNDVDFLILCRMSYIPFDGAVGREPERVGMLLKDAAETVFKNKELSADEHFFEDDDEELLHNLVKSDRFALLRLTGYVNIFSEKHEEQFSAVTVLLPDDTCAVCFRGTDGTLVGWKEDFNMAFSDTVSAQTDAAKYVNEVYKALKRDLRLGGHSKGGNLAVYSAAFCESRVQRRVVQVRNFDGPGFNMKLINEPNFQKILPLTHTILPNSSVVGMLLEHEEDFSIVQSTSVSILQHNIYTWEIMRAQFITVEELTNSSRFIDATLKEWLSSMPPEKREKMVNGIYSVFAASDEEQLRKLFSGKNTLTILKAVGDMDDDTKEAISEMMKILKSAMKDSIGSFTGRIFANLPFAETSKKKKTRKLKEA